MKSEEPRTRLSVAAIIVVALLMVAVSAFLLAVCRQVQETRQTFKGWVVISGPIDRTFAPSSPHHVIYLSAWARCKYAYEEWYDASELVLENLGQWFLQEEHRPSTPP